VFYRGNLPLKLSSPGAAPQLFVGSSFCYYRKQEIKNS